jgi:hypothetical protein
MIDRHPFGDRAELPLERDHMSKSVGTFLIAYLAVSVAAAASGPLPAASENEWGLWPPPVDLTRESFSQPT